MAERKDSRLKNEVKQPGEGGGRRSFNDSDRVLVIVMMVLVVMVSVMVVVCDGL